MSIESAQRLFDTATRLQVYVERVKNYESLQFGYITKQVDEEFSKILNNLNYLLLFFFKRFKICINVYNPTNKLTISFTTESISVTVCMVNPRALANITLSVIN